MDRIASQCERQGKKLQKEPQTRTLHRRRCQEAALAVPDRCMLRGSNRCAGAPDGESWPRSSRGDR